MIKVANHIAKYTYRENKGETPEWCAAVLARAKGNGGKCVAGSTYTRNVCNNTQRIKCDGQTKHVFYPMGTYLRKSLFAQRK